MANSYQTQNGRAISVHGTEIPLRPAKDVRDEADTRGGDMEKVATAAVAAVLHRGVRVASRYGKSKELETMIRALERVSKDDKWGVVGMWCDSKASSTYEVELAYPSQARALRVVAALDRAFLAESGGHNGIGVWDSDVCADPNWSEGMCCCLPSPMSDDCPF